MEVKIDLRNKGPLQRRRTWEVYFNYSLFCNRLCQVDLNECH